MREILKKLFAERRNKISYGRLAIVAGMCGLVCFAVLIIKLYDVQITNNAYYRQLAVEQQTSEQTISAERGAIRDTNGNILAMSAKAYDIFISPYEQEKYEEDPAFVAGELARILDLDYNEVLKRFDNKESWYELLAKKVDPQIAEEVQTFKSENKLKSVHLDVTSKRYYPYDSLACHVIGFVGEEGYGLYGVESTYNTYLSGEDGTMVTLDTGGNTKLTTLYTNEAVNGSDITLTLDVSIQYIAEKYLKEAVEKYEAKNGGSCVIMDPHTGAILAMASEDSYDLNNYNQVSEKVMEALEEIEDEDERAEALRNARLAQWSNMALSEAYEPGSVFKIVTLAMALEENQVNRYDTSFFCGGAINVPGRQDVNGNPIPLHCSVRSGHGTLDLFGSVQKSCNVAFVTMGIDVGAERFYDYIRAFGLFDETGIDLGGEGESIWWSEDVFFEANNLSQLASASFGQTFAVTPLQMITAVAAVANGGYLLEPYVVQEITDQAGNTVYANERNVVRQVVSEDTSALAREILESVVSSPGGTGGGAYVEGYKIAGKTGTSEKIETITDEGKDYIVSFCGFAPADDPEIIVLFMLDTPSTTLGYYVSGGNMAAPMVGSIIKDVLDYLGYHPEIAAAENE